MMRMHARWRNFRSYATKLFPSSRIPSGDVSRSRGLTDQPPLTSRPPLTSPSEVVTLVAFGAAFNAFVDWSCYHGCNLYQACKAEFELRNMLEELDRKKKESPEAYLEMIHREMMSLKTLNYKREELAAWEVKNYERKIAALESKLHAWTKDEDTAPVPQGLSLAN